MKTCNGCRKSVKWALVALVSGTALCAAVGEEKKCPVSANVRGRENIEWSISYAYGLTDETCNLPRVLLIGDSICNGYQRGVRERLKGKMNVTYWVSSYCVTSPAYLPLLSVYLDGARYDVIHFNNGLHSLSATTDAWAKGLKATLAYIREKQPQAKIVWCSLTPLTDSGKTAKCRELNAAAARVVGELGGIATDDLFALCDPLDRAENWCDEYHFRPEAKARQADQVASSVFISLARPAPVRPVSMGVLSLGSVRAEGFLQERMTRLAEGLTGHAEELYEDIGNSDWLTGGKRGGMFAWERGPYYAKGLVALALVLDDARLRALAKRWVDAILASQREDGDFGPKKRNWWANMLALSLLRDWAAATGDERVVPFLERYFRFQRGAFESYPLSAESRWAVARAGDELDVVLWLHEKTGRDEWRTFAESVAAQSTDWTRYYMRGGNPGEGDKANGFCSHIVNFMQGLKTPPLQWRLDGDERKRNAYHAAFSRDGWLMKCYGRPDRMLNGSEQLSDLSASEGTELCAVAERIASCQVQTSVCGDAEAADDLEIVAYNALMSMVAPDGRGMTYYCLLNQPACVDKSLNFANNGESVGSLCPGPHSGFGCCRSNFHMAWPKFVQSMWMEREGGLAAVAYGPCKVSTPIATIEESGDYPFGANVRLQVKATNGGEWPLFVRIPGWCDDAKVAVNGEDVCGAKTGTFVKLSRLWRAGDVVTLTFPQSTRLSRWGRNAVSVRRGALLYALKIDGTESVVTRYKIPYEDKWIEDGGGEFPRKEIKPVSPWGYALLLDEKGQLVGERADGAELNVSAVRTDFGGWGYMRQVTEGRAIDPPPSPLPREGGSVETVTLVPFGLTQIRVALFPWMLGE